MKSNQAWSISEESIHEMQDIFNPDISGMGGLIDIITISNEASNNGISISPHCWNSMSVSASAILHVCSNVLIQKRL